MYEAGADPFGIVKPHVIETKMFFVTAVIGADEARDLLLHNKNPEKGKEGTNRKKSQATIDRYAAKMVLGEWDVNPQPIIFSEVADDGVSDLNDGQQRLYALIKAAQQQPGLRLPFTFCFDAPAASKLVVDQGKRRLPADFLAMVGHENANAMSHAVRMLYAVTQLQPFKSIGIWRKVELAPQTYIAFLKQHIQLKDGLDQANKVRMGSSRKPLIMPYVGAVLWWLLQDNFDAFVAQRFFTGLASGADLKVDDPRLKAREFFAMKAAEKPPYKWDGFEQLAVLIATANAYLQGHDSFSPKTAFNKLTAKHFPELVSLSEMPKTMIVAGNDPDPTLAV